MKKFELALETEKEFFGIKMYRVRALTSFSDAKAGDLGGYVQREDNLSQDGKAWVYGDARVYGNARVYGDAQVYRNAQVCGDAQVYGDSHVHGNAQVSGNALVYGYAQVYGNARVYGNANVSGNAFVYNDAQVYRNARVHGNANVSGNAQVCGDAYVTKPSECVNIINQKNNITLTPNLIIIGCKTWSTLKEFEETYNQIGKDNGYTEDEAEMTAELVRAVMKRFKPIVTEIEVEHNGVKYKFDLAKAKELGLVK